jgi:hypothetical protein
LEDLAQHLLVKLARLEMELTPPRLAEQLLMEETVELAGMLAQVLLEQLELAQQMQR